jgi:subtilase family serine protease
MTCVIVVPIRPKKKLRHSGIRFEALEARTCFSASPTGLTPAEVRNAYGFSQVTYTTDGTLHGATGRGETIAIIDAYSDPNIASDLETFDAEFALKNNDINGNFVLSVATPEGVPTQNAGWDQEIALDVEWAHATAPKADILLVEAKSSDFSDLMNAVNYARNQAGVVAVSMSWGGPEFSGETSYDTDFTTPANHIGGNGLAGGVTFVASSGDSGAGSSYPAASPNVLSVGGTTLTIGTGGNYISETAWSGSGGGTSSIEKTNIPTVAYDADPASGFSVYDSIPTGGQSDWETIGGTSAGAPQWAGLIADIDQGLNDLGQGSLDGATQTIPDLFALPTNAFHDITTGSNGAHSAGVGYDLVTGLGTPNVINLIADQVGTTITSSVSGPIAAATPAAPTAAPPATPSFSIAPSIVDSLGIAGDQNIFSQVNV